MLHIEPSNVSVMNEIEQEAAALKARFGGQNRAGFARAHKIPGGDAMIYQHITGRRPLSLDAAVAYAAAFGVPLAEISPRLAKTIAGAQPGLIGRSDHITVPVFDVAGSMGFGTSQPDHEAVIDGISLAPNWVHRNLSSISSPANLAVISGYGDSMAPTFSDGDLLLVDRGVSEIRLDAVYVLALNHELYIKRIQRRITDGAIIIKSDNPLYDPVVVGNGEREELQVLGRVVWAWNGRKL